ncbi:MAG TPA: peptide ABC transporter substrate-binding protein [Negativicutes bacterium]|nr:peptide ABC transporter substrate-binding protein [Negativicutes bacterium]
MKNVSKMILTFLLVLILGLLIGCSKKTEKVDSNSGTAIAGGKINVGSAVEPETWNPLLSELMAVQEVGRLVFSGLLLQNDKGAWIPDLASEVPTVANGGISSDGLTVTYRLKPDLKWQDGQPISAKDIQFTYDFIMRNRSQVPWREGYEKIQSLRTPDSATIVIRFSEPYAYALKLFPFVLPSHRAAELMDVRTQNFARLPIGSGPYILKEWRRGDALIFEANSQYHRGRPLLDMITYKIVTDRQIVLSQLKIGEVDLVNNIGFDQLDQARAITGVNTFITQGTIWEHADFNLDNPLFADVRVRQAIALGIDRPMLIESVLKNAAFPAYTDIHPLSWAAIPIPDPPVRNMVKAKELLEAAGWKAGYDGILAREGRRFSFTLTAPSGDKPREEVAEALSRQLREIGVEMRVQFVAGKAFFGEILPNRRFEMALFAWVNSTEPDNYDLWHSRRIPSASNRGTGKNYAGWKSTEVDFLLESTRRNADVESRRDALRRLQEMLLAEVPVIPLYYRTEIAAAKRSIVNYKPNPFSGNFWNVWEWGLR